MLWSRRLEATPGRVQIMSPTRRQEFELGSVRRESFASPHHPTCGRPSQALPRRSRCVGVARNATSPSLVSLCTESNCNPLGPRLILAQVGEPCQAQAHPAREPRRQWGVTYCCASGHMPSIMTKASIVERQI